MKGSQTWIGVHGLASCCRRRGTVGSAATLPPPPPPHAFGEGRRGAVTPTRMGGEELSEEELCATAAAPPGGEATRRRLLAALARSGGVAGRSRVAVATDRRWMGGGGGGQLWLCRCGDHEQAHGRQASHLLAQIVWLYAGQVDSDCARRRLGDRRRCRPRHSRPANCHPNTAVSLHWAARCDNGQLATTAANTAGRPRRRRRGHRRRPFPQRWW